MRNKLTKITLAASIALAMAFTFGCSDDKDDEPNKYCVWIIGGTDYSCQAFGSKFTEKDCKDASSAAIKTEARANAPKDMQCESGGDDSSSSGGTGGTSPSSSSGGTGGTSPSSSSGGTTVSSSSNTITKGTPVTDVDGQTYETVVIGIQTWMAKNLNRDIDTDTTGGSKCYNDSIANCEKYGRLYNWVTAMALPEECNKNECQSQITTPHQGICPAGWHLPSHAEWTTLINYVGGASTAGNYLKATSGWTSYRDVENLDTYGFSALPGGSFHDGRFNGTGSNGRWWSSSERNSSNANNRYMEYLSGDVSHYSYEGKDNYYSIRCLKN